jgi:hypothetical protein
MLRSKTVILCLAAALWMPSYAGAYAVSPTSLDMDARRGEAVEETVAIINNGAAEQTYYLGTMAFVPDETSGVPQFIQNSEDRFGMSGWISFPISELSIPAWTKVDVPFVVTVPNDAPSGTHYAAVTVSTAPSEVVESNGATLEAKTAILAFLTVAGETVEKAVALDFVSPDESVTAHDVSYAYRVQNQGNVSVIPNARIVATDLFGRTVVDKDANPTGARVLPGTTRTFTGEIAESPSGFFQAASAQWSTFAVGPVTMRLVVENVDTSGLPPVRYLMFPWQLATVAVGGVALTALAARGLRRRAPR